jgi:hypothetical protein
MEKSAVERDYYKILLVGQSGNGKTYSFRDMNPDTTGFINVENKPLPFKNKFKYHKRISRYSEVLETLVEYAKNPEITSIVVDSFSAYGDLLLAEARKTKKGFDIWSMYNDEIGRFMTAMKWVPKEVFVTAHYEILNLEGAQEKRVKVKAKEWESVVEKEFTIVMFADKKFNEKGKPEYYYQLVGEGMSAKCPPDLFGQDTYSIPNDGNMIFNTILNYTK